MYLNVSNYKTIICSFLAKDDVFRGIFTKSRVYFLHFLPKITYEKNTKKCLDHKIVLISCSITQLFGKFVLISCVLISCRINYMSYTFHVLRYIYICLLLQLCDSKWGSKVMPDKRERTYTLIHEMYTTCN